MTDTNTQANDKAVEAMSRAVDRCTTYTVQTGYDHGGNCVYADAVLVSEVAEELSAALQHTGEA